MDIMDIAISKSHTNSVSSGIASSSYDPNTSTMTVQLRDGNSYQIEFDDGVSVQDRLVLDNIKYDKDASILLVDDKEVLTKDDAVSDDDDLNFDNMFD